MLFSDDFLEKLRTDPIDNFQYFYDQIVSIVGTEIFYPEPNWHQSRDGFFANDNSFWDEEEYFVLAEAFYIMDSIVLNFGDEKEFQRYSLEKFETNTAGNKCWLAYDFLQALNKLSSEHKLEIRLQLIKNNIHLRMSKSAFIYEFSEGDLHRIQDIINQLREQITSCELFEQDHKQRLLKRLEKLQGELHKKMSDLDRFWGLIGDAGVALGKFGEDAKPIVDLIKELTGIAWNTQSRAEELPSGTPVPLLEKDGMT